MRTASERRVDFDEIYNNCISGSILLKIKPIIVARPAKSAVSIAARREISNMVNFMQ